MSFQFTYEPNRKIVANKRVERSDDRKYVCVTGRFSDSWGLPASVSFFPFPLPLPFFFLSRSIFCAITCLACLQTPYIKNKNSGGFIDSQCKGVGMGKEENRRAIIEKKLKEKLNNVCVQATTRYAG